MLERLPTKQSEVPTLREVQASKRRSQKVLTIDMSDVRSAPVVTFIGVWSNSDMKAVDRVLSRQYKIYRAQLRKDLAPLNGGN